MHQVEHILIRVKSTTYSGDVTVVYLWQMTTATKHLGSKSLGIKSDIEN